MIAIPNMKKPKECKECQWHLDFYIEDEQVGGLCTITEKDDRENTCPLEEIAEPTETLIHDIRKVIAFIEPRMIIASTYDEQIERAKAVKDWLMGIVGERRNDE